MTQTAKRTFLILAVIAIAGFGAYRIRQARAAKAAAAPAASLSGGSASRMVSVSLTEARTGQVRDEVHITGSLKPKEQVDVSSKVTGRVKSLSVNIGDFVWRGQLIAVLEGAELSEQVRRAEAARAVVSATADQRRAELSSAKADLDRAKQLLDAGLIAKQEYDAKLTSFRVFQAQLALTQAQGEQAASELRELKIQLEQMQIVAPISGYVAQKTVDVGSVVGPTTPIVRLVNVSTLVTVANVPERQIGKLRVGARAEVRVDAIGDNVFTGRVARIAPVLDPGTRTAFVEIEIPNPDRVLRAEMFARVKLDLPNMREAVLIPRDALVYRGSQAGVFVVSGKTDSRKQPEFRPVETGLTEGRHVEVLGNLAAGTTIVNHGASMLSEGDRINVMEDQTEAERLEQDGKNTKPSASTALRDSGVTHT
jgi:RND family efflux transporter MFP subunit